MPLLGVITLFSVLFVSDDALVREPYPYSPSRLFLLPVSTRSLVGSVPVVPILLTAVGISFLAGLLGGSFRINTYYYWNKYHGGMMPFIATLPMSCADMVGAILKTAAWSALTTYVEVIVTVSLVVAVVLSGKLQDVADGWEQMVRAHMSGAITAGIVAVPIWLLVWRCKLRMDSLYIKMGRTWITILSLAYAFGCFVLFIAVSIFIISPEARETFLSMPPWLLTLLPWLLTLLILGRLLLSVWAFYEVSRRGLVERRGVCWRFGCSSRQHYSSF